MEPIFDTAVPISRIFLHLENPRFEPVETELEAIERLCTKEEVYPLALDIVDLESINPLELVALTPLDQNLKKGARNSYIAEEGNRRICALKLLSDPDLAPTNLRSKFKALAEKWTPITHVAAIIFEDSKAAKIWVDRMHEGAQGGIGRRSWTSDQKARNSNSNKNKAALDLLDYSEEQGLISKEERQGKLTTVQRFVGNETFKEYFGLDTSNRTELKRDRPQDDFNEIAKVFLNDLKNGTAVSSRMNKEEIIKYSRDVIAKIPVKNSRIDAEPLKPIPTKKVTKKRKTKPSPPKKAERITHSIEIQNSLKKLNNKKLQSLYHSISDLELDNHTPLVAIGIWAFIETMVKSAGAKTDFCGFLNSGKFKKYGIPDKDEHKAMNAALKRLQDGGNHTKHNTISAIFNGDQLNNDMELLERVFVACIEDAISQNK